VRLLVQEASGHRATACRMLALPPTSKGSAWLLITRFGESGVLLPIVIALLISLVWRTRSTRPALVWTLPFGAASLATAASKIAFLGFGVGVEALDFTGFSGHATVAAAVYPMLACMFTVRASRHVRGMALVLAYGIAMLVMVSRYEVGAHSLSEAVAGFLLGACASVIAVRQDGDSRPLVFLAGTALAAMSLRAVAPPGALPSIHPHDLVTRFALKLSNHSKPFTRADLHRHRASRPDATAQPDCSAWLAAEAAS
jgi:membrane-associated phospholipid phosphatase